MNTSLLKGNQELINSLASKVSTPLKLAQRTAKVYPARQQRRVEARKLRTSLGDAAEAAAESWIIDKESGGRTKAKNPRSSAFGIGQLIRSNRERYAKKLSLSGPDTTDPEEQLAMLRAYVKDRYGSMQNAKRFWEQRGWY